MTLSLPFMEPIHILGSGSIGLFWASSIRSAFPSYPLAVLFRGHHRTSPRFLNNGSDEWTVLPARGGVSTRAVRSEKGIIVCTQRQEEYDDDDDEHFRPSVSSKSGSGISIRVGSGNKTFSARRKRPPQPRMSRVPFQFIDDDETKIMESKRPIRNLILCTKAYQAENAIQNVKSRFVDHTNLRIMILSNGALDIRERLEQVFRKDDVESAPEMVLCTTTHGVINETNADDEMFHLRHVGVKGKTFIGGQPKLAQLWDKSGLATQSVTSEQMEILLWRKLAANCVCNPLTALWRVPNGKLAATNPTLFASLRAQIVKEVSNVAHASLENRGFVERHSELRVRYDDPLSPEAMDAFVEQVIQANFQNTSSMHRDVEQRKRTEVDNLNGYIVRKGHEFGVPTPSNEELVGKIQDITSAFY